MTMRLKTVALRARGRLLLALLGSVALCTPASAADTYLPACFKPADTNKVIVHMPKKAGPYRIALANGFIGNGWRVQMIEELQAYAAKPEVKAELKELRIVSVGTDVSAQIAAMDNFISAGYDAILVDANSPTAFKPVLRRAKEAGVVIVSFDNTLDDPSKWTNLIQVNHDQRDLGRMAGDWLLANMKQKKSVLEVRGVPGNSVDRDRHDGFRAALATDPGIKVTEVIGMWDDGTGQKVTADAFAVNGDFDGVATQGGSTGVTQAILNSGKPLMPMSGEAENGYRKLIVAHAKDGLLGASAGTSPGLSAVSLKAAIAALHGEALPQEVSVPIPSATYKNLVAGTNYYPDVSDTFFDSASITGCDVVLSAAEITGQAAPK